MAPRGKVCRWQLLHDPIRIMGMLGGIYGRHVAAAPVRAAANSGGVPVLFHGRDEHPADGRGIRDAGPGHPGEDHAGHDVYQESPPVTCPMITRRR